MIEEHMTRCKQCIEGPLVCHKCPSMEGDVMPFCMGTAARSHGPRDLEACTCPTPREEKRKDRQRIERLEREMAKLSQFVYRLHADELR